MGEVYRARDTRLGRDVAIKTLPRFLAAEPVWGRDGLELFYIADAGGADIALMAAQVTLQPTLRVGTARRPLSGKISDGWSGTRV